MFVFEVLHRNQPLFNTNANPDNRGQFLCSTNHTCPTRAQILNHKCPLPPKFPFQGQIHDLVFDFGVMSRNSGGGKTRARFVIQCHPILTFLNVYAPP